MAAIDSQAEADSVHRFAVDLALQTRRPRILGLWLCALCVGVTLWDQGHLPWVSVATVLLFNVLVWPEVARWRTRRSRTPIRTESQNLWMDALYCGLWIAAMQGALVPSAALVMATSLSNASMGGPRAMFRAWGAQAAGLVLGMAALGWQLEPTTSTTAVLGTLPLLLAYPMLMGNFMHRMNQRLNAQRRELRYLSEHDALSGVHNRRFFDQHLRQVFSQFLRHPRALSLLVADVDDFKRINDQHGHGQGDQVIRQLATALAESARAGDVVARLGGDEFVVLLSDTGADQAMLYAQRVQQRLNELTRQSSMLPNLQVSFGVAMAHAGMSSHEQWLEQADRALYRSKSEDRGGISLAQPALAAQPVVTAAG